MSDLGSDVTRVLGMIAEARRTLLGAVAELAEARNEWAAALAGTRVPEMSRLGETADHASAESARAVAALDLADQLLHRYLDEIGYRVDSTPLAHSAPSGMARVDVAKRRVGQRPDGSQARGEWVRSDGWSARLVSGPNDSYYEAAKEFARTLPARDRAAQRLATHVEIKVAVAMRREDLTDETVVVDRQVCGTREYDAHQRVTCDKYLSTFLPPGACLRVVQADGTIKTYRGKAG